jgi:hypothetical protein
MTEPSTTPRSQRVIPRASLVVLVAALPLIYFFHLPIEGWIVAASLWAFGVALNVWSRSIARSGPVHLSMGVAALGMFVRMGLAMIVVLLVGTSNDVGETTVGMGDPVAAATALILYTVLFTLDLGERMSEDLAAWRALDERTEEGT